MSPVKITEQMSEKISVDIKNLTEDEFIKFSLINLKEKLRLRVIRQEINKEFEKILGLTLEINEKLINDQIDDESRKKCELYEQYLIVLQDILCDLGQPNSKKNVIFDFVYKRNKI